HLPHVDQFVFTDQTGAEFDSVQLHGQPYVVSFFFASCPSFCRDLNNELARVNKILNNTDIRFLTITVDPERDTTEVLKTYAAGYDAKPERWAFLLGEKAQFARVGQRMFNLVVDRDTHTDNIVLVDKWGRYRDRFKWDQPQDMKRFVEVAREVAAETEPPLGKMIQTRNVLAGVEPANWGNLPWLRDFHLTDADGKHFFSRDLTGEVWLVNFSQNGTGTNAVSPEWLRELQSSFSDAPKLINLAVEFDPETDPLPADDWVRYSTDWRKLARIGRECFGLKMLTTENGQPAIDTEFIESISNSVFVIDRWGNVRDQIDVSVAANQARLIDMIQMFQSETMPPKPTMGFSVGD
ncbi:MAG: SCO family protein, partial [Rubripirellula sp.]